MIFTADNLFLYSLPKFNKQTYTKIEKDSTAVEYKYNSFGYRSPEPETFTQPFILAVGCSHTEGTGQLETETWTYKLSQLVKMPVANFGQVSSGADFIEHLSYKWIQHYSLPNLIIIQWPNPIRTISWNQQEGQFRNINAQDSLFRATLISGELNFYVPWVKNINLVNQLWSACNVPVLNCYFDTFPEEVVQYVIPKIYSNDIDIKQPWLFDSKAHDLSHHSDWCTTQWANRINDLLTLNNFPV